MPILKGDLEKGDGSSHSTDSHIDNDTLQAAILALTAFFRFLSNCSLVLLILMYSVLNMARCCLYCRGGGKVGKKAVEQSYSSVLAVLILQLGSCHGFARSGQQEPLRYLYSLNSYISPEKKPWLFTVQQLNLSIIQILLYSGLLTAFQAFCECVGDLEMGKVCSVRGDTSAHLLK